MSKLYAVLRLMRPANIITAVADILAGAAIAGYFLNTPPGIELWWLVAATACLYGGGVVLNDVFDAKLDAVERPERPIPSGIVSVSAAAWVGSLLLIGGICCAALSGGIYSSSFLLAILIALASVVYDKWGKHHFFWGPLNMGLCRGLNLLLGMSILPESIATAGWISIVPVIYIAAITIISRGEVHGSNKKTLYGAGLLYAVVILAIAIAGIYNKQVLWTSCILAAFAYMIFPPWLRAVKAPSGKAIGKAVKAGVIALILMNAAWAAAFGAPVVMICIVFLLPLSIGLAKLFAVT